MKLLGLLVWIVGMVAVSAVECEGTLESQHSVVSGLTAGRYGRRSQQGTTANVFGVTDK
jgi:hypothetical protein